MNVNLRSVLVPVLLLCGGLLSFPPSALAQVSTSGSGMSMGFTAKLGKPEGVNTPLYLMSSQCWYDTISSDPDPVAVPSLNLESGVAYAWAGGPKRTIIETNGPMQYSSDHNGYLWSFDLSGDADRAFGSNSIVYLQTRNQQYLTTNTAAPYVLGSTPITVLDANKNPVSNADVKLVNGTTGEYSEAMTGPTGQLTFGMPVSGAADAPYAPGLASDSYYFKVTAQGMADAVSSGGPGGSFPSNTYAVAMGASASTITPSPVAPSSGGSGTCSAQTIPVSASDPAGSGGIPGWSDGSFPASVQPAYLHSGSWSESVNVPVAGSYTITGDCPTAGNIGTITLSVGGVAGTPVSCTSASPGAATGANFGTFTLVAGANTLSFGLSGQFGAVKTLYLVPGASCGASSGSGSGSGSIFDMDGFFKRLLAFFYDPDEFAADCADFKAAVTRLFTYGPLGIPASVAGLFAYGQGLAQHTPSNDPNYWVWPTFNQLPGGASVYTGPADYNPGQVYKSTFTPGTVEAFSVLASNSSSFPLDMAPYHQFIIFGRWIVFCFGWAFFMWSQVQRFTPELKV